MGVEVRRGEAEVMTGGAEMRGGEGGVTIEGEEEKKEEVEERGGVAGMRRGAAEDLRRWVQATSLVTLSTFCSPLLS